MKQGSRGRGRSPATRSPATRSGTADTSSIHEIQLKPGLRKGIINKATNDKQRLNSQDAMEGEVAGWGLSAMLGSYNARFSSRFGKRAWCLDFIGFQDTTSVQAPSLRDRMKHGREGQCSTNNAKRAETINWHGQIDDQCVGDSVHSERKTRMPSSGSSKRYPSATWPIDARH